MDSPREDGVRHASSQYQQSGLLGKNSRRVGGQVGKGEPVNGCIGPGYQAGQAGLVFMVRADRGVELGPSEY